MSVCDYVSVYNKRDTTYSDFIQRIFRVRQESESHTAADLRDFSHANFTWKRQHWGILNQTNHIS